jgi:hypothetical protein
MEAGIELVELYNLFGARVRAYRTNGWESIIRLDMSGLTAGVYCYRLTNGYRPAPKGRNREGCEVLIEKNSKLQTPCNHHHPGAHRGAEPQVEEEDYDGDR